MVIWSSVYASILVVLFIVLSARVIGLRRRNRVSLGHGGNEAVLQAMRVHANFAEYAPFGLLMAFFVEMTTRHAGEIQVYWVHVCALPLVAGRLVHALGVSARPQRMALRVAGMVLTFLSLGLSAVVLIVSSLVAAVG